MSASSNSTRIVRGSGTQDDPYEWPHNVIPQPGEYVVSRTGAGSHAEQINEGRSTHYMALVLDDNPGREYAQEFIEYDPTHLSKYTETTHPFLDPRLSMFGIRDSEEAIEWLRSRPEIETVETDRSGTPYCFLPLHVTGTVYATTR